MLSVLIIWVVTGVLVFEAIQRCRHPEDVDGKLMFILAVSGDCIRSGSGCCIAAETGSGTSTCSQWPLAPGRQRVTWQRLC